MVVLTTNMVKSTHTLSKEENSSYAIGPALLRGMQHFFLYLIVVQCDCKTLASNVREATSYVWDTSAVTLRPVKLQKVKSWATVQSLSQDV